MGGRACFSSLGRTHPACGRGLACGSALALAPEIRELVGGFRRSLPTPQRCFRILPGNQREEEAGEAGLPASAAGLRP